MTRFQLWTLAVALMGSTAWAGSIGDPAPTNPCDELFAFKSKLAVLDVSSDGDELCSRGLVYADTAITCTIKEPDIGGATADLVIEYYDPNGVPMNSPLNQPGVNDTICGIAPGDTVTFTLSTLPQGPSGMGPWASNLASPGFVNVPGGGCGPGCALHGFARIFSTSKKIHCTATRIDTQAFCQGLTPVPLTTTSLKVIKVPRQKGD